MCADDPRTLNEKNLVKALLGEIGEALKSRGISLEELIESGREIRQEIYDEKYTRDKR